MQTKLAVLATATFAVAFLLIGCPGGGGGGGDTDAGVDANDVIIEPIIKVSGTASIHPNAAAYMTGAGLTVPSVEGLTLRVEEPLGAALNDPNAIFGTVVLPADGTFSVDQVDTAKVSLGIAAGILDLRDGGAPEVVRTATGLYDVQVSEGKPTVDLAGTKAYAIPTAFHDKLTELVTPARISAIQGDPDGGYASLIEVGFILGKIVDAQGNPVAGAQVETSPASYATSQIFYPDEGLTTVNQNGTSANGLFIFVNKAGPTPTTFTLNVKNRTEYLRRNAGASAGAGLVLTVFPGQTAP